MIVSFGAGLGRKCLCGILLFGMFPAFRTNAAVEPSVQNPGSASSETAVQLAGGEKKDFDSIVLTCKTDKEALSYAPGEPIQFILKVDGLDEDERGNYFVKWNRSGDDRKIETGIERITEKPLKIVTSLAQPGFVRFYAELAHPDGKPVLRQQNKRMNPIAFEGGAAVEPEKLTGVPEPEDFDRFWQKQRARLAEVPLKFEWKQCPSGNPKVLVYAVRVDCAGPGPVTGYLTLPSPAPAHSLPATIIFAGYGYNPVQDKPPKGGPPDRITFRINAHGYELNESADYYRKFGERIGSKRWSYAFDPVQNSDPETAYFNGMALRVLRAVEFVKSLQEWNRKELAVEGSSQGGLQALWAAGLDSDVTMALLRVPWCCDMGGESNFGRLSGNWRVKYVPGLNYYDPIHFAKRIRCPVNIIRAGLGDYISPPSGITVLYNNLKGAKKIAYYQGSTHGFIPRDPEILVREEK